SLATGLVAGGVGSFVRVTAIATMAPASTSPPAMIHGAFDRGAASTGGSGGGAASRATAFASERRRTVEPAFVRTGDRSVVEPALSSIVSAAFGSSRLGFDRRV